MKHLDKPKEHWTYSFISNTFQEAISGPVGNTFSSAPWPEARFLGQHAVGPSVVL